jgi:L-glutamine-phosphate cytidylyltransferase
MKAIVLAAGQGSRLRPLTDDRPKCLVELRGRALLERQRAVLERAGIRDIAVVAGYRADQVRRIGLPVVVNARYETTNMVESLFCARVALAGDDDVLVCYGDVVFEERVIAALRSSQAPVALAVNTDWLKLWSLRMPDPLADAETMKIAPDGLVTELGKKPRSAADVQGQYMGLFTFRADYVKRVTALYDSLDRGATYDGQAFSGMFMTSFLQALIDRGHPVEAVRVPGGWLEVDTLADLAVYERLAAAGTLDEYCVLDR